MDNREKILFLKQINGIGNATIKRVFLPLIENYISDKEIIVKIKELYPKVTDSEIEEAKNKKDAIIQEIDGGKKFIIITILDEDYPDELKKQWKIAPPLLYVWGNKELLNTHGIGVIGTRHPCNTSIIEEEKFVNQIIEENNMTIISGLALGCDGVGHKTAVKNGGKTMAVLPSGFHNITPASHRILAVDIVENNGCLLTEYNPDDKVLARTYVERDKIVAALSDKLLVVECGTESGTMHTVRAALEMNKPIGCYNPGTLKEGDFSGNTELISKNIAIPIVNLNELSEFIKTDISSINRKNEDIQNDLSAFINQEHI